MQDIIETSHHKDQEYPPVPQIPEGMMLVVDKSPLEEPVEKFVSANNYALSVIANIAAERGSWSPIKQSEMFPKLTWGEASDEIIMFTGALLFLEQRGFIELGEDEKDGFDVKVTPKPSIVNLLKECEISYRAKVKLDENKDLPQLGS